MDKQLWCLRFHLWGPMEKHGLNNIELILVFLSRVFS